MKKKITRVVVGLIALFFVAGNAVKGQWTELGGNYTSTLNSWINTLTTDAGGNVYAAGRFTNGNGKNYVAKWSGSSWSELGGTNNSTFNNNINSLATDAAGNIYAAGAFTNSNGKWYVAQWNGSSWSELGGNNNSTFNSTFGIETLTTDAAGNIYAAGYFTNSKGKTYVAKWNGSSWIELGGTNNSTFNQAIYTLTTDAAGNIYAAGAFTNANRNEYVAKWSGSTWSELGGTNNSTFNSSIFTLVTDVVGNLYAAGNFKNGNGNRYVAQWSGSSWSELGGTNTSTFGYPIFTMTVDASGNLYAAGLIWNRNGKWFVAKWDGNSWSELGGTNNSTFNSTIQTLTTDAAGNIYAAGDFTNSNGKYYVAKYSGIPTPVTLTTFTAQALPPSPLGVQVALKWQTATEINTSDFIIEQSSDGKTFTAKGTVKAVSSGANKYAFDVPFSSPSGDRGGLGVRFFGLKMIDKDGSFTYSKIVSVSLTTNNSPLITISPNPAKDFTTVSIHISKAKTIQYVLINAEGKQLSVQKQALPAGNSSFPINLKGLAKGIYWLKIEGVGEKQLVVE